MGRTTLTVSLDEYRISRMPYLNRMAEKKAQEERAQKEQAQKEQPQPPRKISTWARIKEAIGNLGACVSKDSSSTDAATIPKKNQEEDWDDGKTFAERYAINGPGSILPSSKSRSQESIKSKGPEKSPQYDYTADDLAEDIWQAQVPRATQCKC